MVQIRILGCGASIGVPIIGCACSVCSSLSPKNKRTRSSIIMHGDNGVNILVDTAPDLRLQCLYNDIKTIDAVIYTHAHSDHVHGIDDLRPFYFATKKTLPVYAVDEVITELDARFSYAFISEKEERPRAFLNFNSIEYDSYTNIAGIDLKFFKQGHGNVNTVGIRIGDIAYSIDVNKLEPPSIEALQGVKIWIVDCLQLAPSYAHADISLVKHWVGLVKPERVILTHMNHTMDYDNANSYLPDGFEFAYDGMLVCC
jgi:phosphoribosyl 1,2-cyclic phosphate phosphodiesterase